MPNDAKLGLAVGVGLVILVAVVFFGKDLVPEHATADATVAVTAARTPEDDAANDRIKAQTTSHTKPAAEEENAPAAEVANKES